MRKCKNCRKEYDAEFDGEYGCDISGNGVMGMGFGSKHDGNKYKFTLVAGWYCWGCLDEEIDQGLVQPLVTYRMNKDALNDMRIKRYRLRGLEDEIK